MINQKNKKRKPATKFTCVKCGGLYTLYDAFPLLYYPYGNFCPACYAVEPKAEAQLSRDPFEGMTDARGNDNHLVPASIRRQQDSERQANRSDL